jgi:DNA-binding transcriptional ArsR family regulator
MARQPSDDVCSLYSVHAESIDRVNQRLPDSSVLLRLAELFKLLGDQTRVRILMALSAAELCVCDLSEILGLKPSAVSHQLRLLRSARLVRFRREGKNVFYSLDDGHVQELFRQAAEHVQERDVGGAA